MAPMVNERVEFRLTRNELLMFRSRCLAADVPMQLVLRRLAVEWAEGMIETVWDDPVEVVMENIGGSA